ncbi:hypothetical protein CDAR_286171 [Caerostris darwini]|uniref:Uncharacterized protein n=1 Tax=Caerostris darwini TaxID=1538125 RepID=A0AAV4N4G3_9ARAC|nr:hypothetical protein CDAR_286171 [Caerostris darwini]
MLPSHFSKRKTHAPTLLPNISQENAQEKLSKFLEGPSFLGANKIRPSLKNIYEKLGRYATHYRLWSSQHGRRSSLRVIESPIIRRYNGRLNRSPPLLICIQFSERESFEGTGGGATKEGGKVAGVYLMDRVIGR